MRGLADRSQDLSLRWRRRRGPRAGYRARSCICERGLKARATQLFRCGRFTLHSGQESSVLLDCEALSDDDLAAMAAWVTNYLRPFGWIVSIPRGGDRLAEALRPYETAGHDNILIVDDVWTTGRSMQAKYDELAHRYPRDHIHGLVIFCRAPNPMSLPKWAETIFWFQDRQ